VGTSTERRSKPVRVGLYARISTANRGQDVGLQLDELHAVAAQRGWQAFEYVDEGISGTVENRPALDRLMVDARAGRLDLVMVWRFDRFARSTAHLLAALEEFRTLGVGFISTREQIDTTTPVGKVLFTLIAAISEFERSLIVERVRAGVERAQAAGKHCGRPVVAIDLRPAVALLEQGRGLKQVAKILCVNKNTLRARLTEAGEWPRSEGVNKPNPPESTS
jgi:DNA invertase Pin-like site-specific DNA recombinase